MVELKHNDSYIDQYSKKGYLTSASLLMHEDCNLACEYCYEKDNHQNRKISNETIEVALDFLFDNASKAQAEGDDRLVGVTLFGGEPTLNPEGIYHTAYYGCKKSKETGTEFDLNMITNATLFPDLLEKTILEFRDKCNFTIQLSVDGPEDVQDKYRVTKNGSGSWDKVKDVIPKYMELYKDRMNMLNIHGVLDQDSIKELFRSYKYFIDLGIERLWWIPAHNSEWTLEHLEEYDKQLGMIREYITEEVSSGRQQPSFINNYAPLDRCLQNRTSFGKPCGAGDGYCSINYEGKIHACHQFYYYDDFENPELSIGDVHDGVDLDKQRIYIEYDGDDMSCAGTCDHYSCYRCIASNYEANGSMTSQIKGIYCKLMKIDQKHQNKLKEEIEKMGILNSEKDNGCLCAQRTASGTDMNYKDIDFKKPTNNKSCKCGDDSIEEKNEFILSTLLVLAESMKNIEDKLDKMETTGTVINIGK